jgi:hypothetical protein
MGFGTLLILFCFPKCDQHTDLCMAGEVLYLESENHIFKY